MADETFDIDRLRRNWARAEQPDPEPARPVAGEVPNRSGGSRDAEGPREPSYEAVRSASSREPARPPPPVRVKRDPFVESRALLRQVRALSFGPSPSARAALKPEQREAIAPFLARAEELVEAMAVGGGEAGAQDAMREEFLAVLIDLEDLFDVFAIARSP